MFCNNKCISNAENMYNTFYCILIYNLIYYLHNFIIIKTLKSPLYSCNNELKISEIKIRI